MGGTIQGKCFSLLGVLQSDDSAETKLFSRCPKEEGEHSTDKSDEAHKGRNDAGQKVPGGLGVGRGAEDNVGEADVPWSRPGPSGFARVYPHSLDPAYGALPC